MGGLSERPPIADTSRALMNYAGACIQAHGGAGGTQCFGWSMMGQAKPAVLLQLRLQRAQDLPKSSKMLLRDGEKFRHHRGVAMNIWLQTHQFFLEAPLLTHLDDQRVGQEMLAATLHVLHGNEARGRLVRLAREIFRHLGSGGLN